MLNLTWKKAILVLALAAQALPPVRAYYFDAGMRWQYILLFSFLVAYLASPLCAALARRLNVMDRPDLRKIHHRATPLFGGVAVFAALNVALLMNGVLLPGMGVLMAAGAVIFVTGLVDDVCGLSPRTRLFIQLGVSLFVVGWGGLALTVAVGGPWTLWINVPLTLLWLVGLTNAMNFFDGIDGLAAGLSIITSLFLGILAFKTNQPALGWLAVAIAGSCLGFMPYNFLLGRSAALFLGDAGSTYLGFMLAGLAVLGEWSATSHFVSLTAPVLIFGVLIFDMVYITLSRIKNRRVRNVFGPLATPGRDHLHHRLLFMGFARKEAAFAIFTIAVCLGVSALIIIDGQPEDAVLGLLQAGLILAVIVALMWKGRDVPGARRPRAAPPQYDLWHTPLRPLDVDASAREARAACERTH
ncbi:MraY family glycosyltransferase [Desulfocurvus sp.]|jgi:UDP-GlcNAc:undecaprenyl-phosphate GlcNAc-1-phosphate transferase|uniref:MraY family glycosyltransferase n=1 Tax=Desulfocurvus sp. TaxID=2871698 RepID=UPI0025C72D6C|nr:MraY family glycosyltransferase [Desulfocurvus sp.]MCK9240104.1 undecaprenyl/decaprenyl-phosphate alpha-N-acetylglucosaminyl 1-phosphate transferase [Desulfocurvus sp.]